MSRFAVTLGAAVALTLASEVAEAQTRKGFAVNQFQPAERGSGWFVVDSLDLRGDTRPAVGATLDYAHKPLVVNDATGQERLALVRHQVFAHLGAAVVVANRLRVGAVLPFALYQDGEDAVVRGDRLPAARSPAFGDIRLAGDLRVVGEKGDPLTLAVGARVWLPTGSPAQYTSDGAARLGPQVLGAGEMGALVWAARLALIYRARDDVYAGARLGSEVSFGVGVGVKVGGVLVGPEVFGATRLDGDAFLGRDGTPLDAVLGAHYRAPSGVAFAAGLGTGLTRGYGAPVLRALASIEWGPVIADRIAPSDRDHDRIPDTSDACPDWAGPAHPDPEQNGCPPPERVPEEDIDGDRVFDREDACPGLPGVRTSDPMTNGCPVGAPRALAVVTTTEIQIGEQIQFATDSADLLSGSDPVLGAVREILEKHPELVRVRIEGHTDNLGDPAHNDDLSRRRAEAVVRWMVAHDITADRLVAEGFGSKRPLETNATEAGRAKNRRVAFTIVERGQR